VSPEKRIESIQNALQRRFRAAGHGSIRKVQETLNLGCGYFKDQRRPGRRRVDLRVLFRTLDELSVEPADFFADALGAVDMQTVFCSEAAALRQRMKKPPRLLEIEAERGTAELEETAGETLLADADAELAELAAEAEDNPKRAVRRAYTLLPRLADGDVPRLLGIVASAYGRLGHLDTAQVVLARAFEILGSPSDMEVRADLLRRASQLAARQKGRRRAVGLSELATLDYVRCGDLAGVGKSMVDQGGLWLELGNPQRALRSFSSALSYLPADSGDPEVVRQRFVCLMNAGKCQQRLGQLDLACRSLDQAAAVAGAVAPRLRGELAWMRSSLALQCRDWRQAEASLLELLELEPPIAPLDRARASVELIRAQLFAARTLEAYETAKKLTLLVQPLERNRTASTALMELLRIALAGRGMTPDLVERVARSLNDVRAKRLASLSG
jgi:tetratricopeptide (TPR) repeat protein